jgi:hypothetical protein
MPAGFGKHSGLICKAMRRETLEGGEIFCRGRKLAGEIPGKPGHLKKQFTKKGISSMVIPSRRISA